MARDITVTFDDGSSHVYENAPDNITFDQALSRAQKDFSGRTITNLDGGRKPKVELAEPTDQPMGEGLGSAIMGAVSDEPSVFGTPVDPRSKSVLGRVPLASVPAPTVDAQKNLEAMERSGSPGSVMFEPGRRLQRLERGFAKQKAVQDQIRQAEENIRQFDAEKLQREKEEQGLYGPMDLAQDIGATGLRVANTFGQLSVGLATALTGWYPDNPLGVGQWGKMMSKLGYDPDKTRDFYVGLGTPIYQTQQQEVDAAKGILGNIQALALNPVALTMEVIEAIPNAVSIGALGGKYVRMLMTKATEEAAEKGLTGYAASRFVTERVKQQSGKIAAVASGIEGGMSTAQIAEEASRNGKEWGEYIAPALAAGLGTAAIGVSSGKVAQKFGIGDIETNVAARTAGLQDVGVSAAGAGFARKVFGEMTKEGLLEEMPQSAQEQIWTNLTLGKPWDEGLDKAIAKGLVIGGTMGGGHAAINHALNRTSEIVRDQAEKFVKNVERKGMPMTPEELARSKGFLRVNKTEDELINDLDALAEKEETEQNAQDQQTAQGATDAGQPVTPTDRTGVSVAGQPSAEPPAPGAGIVEPSGVVSPRPDVAVAPEGEGVQPGAVEDRDIYGRVEPRMEPIEAAPTSVRPNPLAPNDPNSWQDSTGHIHYKMDAPLAGGKARVTELIDQEQAQNIALKFTDSKGNTDRTLSVGFTQAGKPYWSAGDSSEAAIKKALGEPLYNALGTEPITNTQEYQALVQRIKNALEQPAPTPAPTPAPAPALSTALVPVTPELQKDLKRDSNPYGDDLENIIDENSPTGLWNGAVYYAGTPEVYGNGVNQRAEFPVSLTPITTLAEAQEAESNGMAVYAVTKPQQKTVAELEAEIAKLKGQRNKLLTPTGKEPKKGTKKAAEWDALTEQMNRLWEQVSGIESGRITTGAPALPAPITVTSESRGKDDFGNAVTDVALSNGSKYQIVRLNSTESMGLPGWHDANKFGPTEGGFLGNTKEEAIQELIRRETQRRQQPPLITAEPFTIDVEARVVADTVNNELSPDELRRLTAHYGLSPNSEKFIERVKDDIVRFATEGAAAVAASIRDIIKKLHAGVLSVAMIFNPMNISVPEFVAYPKATATRVEQVYAPLPQGVEEMSDGGKQAYQTLYAALKDRLIAEDKLFTIADKPTGHTYIFRPDGTLLVKTKTLFGKAFGDFYKGNNNLPQNQITPAGLFTFGLRDATRGPDEAKTAGEYDYGKVFVLDKVIDGQYSMTVMHSVWLNESDAQARAQALRSPEQTDSRYSFGCINVDKDTYGFLVANHLNQMDGSSVFIVPDDPINLADLLSGKPENRDGLERNTFTPATQEVVEDADSAKQDPAVVAQQEADRRRTIFKSIVQNAVKGAASVPTDIAEFIKTNMAGVAKLVKLFQDGKLSAEDFAAQMLRFQERVEQQKDIKRNVTNQRMRGFGRVIKALEDAKKAGRVSPETADFAIWFLSKNPALASNLGIKIALPENRKVAEEQEGTAGFYVPFEELVRIITRKDPETGAYLETKADTAVHEILHHLERMLPDDARRAIRKEWAKQITAEMKKAKAEGNTNKVNYLTLVLYANATNDPVAYKAAEKMIVDGEVPAGMYAYFNPSEFWAVRGSGLLAGRYDASSKSRFAKVAQYIREFISSLKRIFGLPSDHAIIQGLEAVLRGDGTFVSNEMLREGDYQIPAKQVTPKGLHPDVAAAINNNDITGALRAIARNTSGLYSVLAARLAELNLPTSIAFNNERDLVRQAIDYKTAKAQADLFTYVRRAYPELYDKYFKDYDKASSLETVYQGLKELEKASYDTSLLSMQLEAVRQAFDKAMPGLKTGGFYVPYLDAIALNAKLPFGLTNRVVLHEIVHAATEYMLRNPTRLTDRQLAAVTDLYRMFNYAKARLGDSAYGFKDIYEFVAEALTNKKFQDSLRALEYPKVKSSILNSFIRFVLNMFGVGNVASAAMVQANEIFSAARSEGAVGTSIRFAPKGPRRARYTKGPLTSRWRTAENAAVRMTDALKAAVTSLPVAGKLSANVRRALSYRARQAELTFVNFRGLKDDIEPRVPFIGSAINLIQKMLADRAQMMNHSKTIVDKWLKMQTDRPNQSRLMGRIMLEATIQGTEVDDKGPGYVDPLLAQPGQKVAPKPLVDAWNALDNDFKQLYREVRNYYTDQLKATIKEMKMRVAKSGKTLSEKKELLREIDRQFNLDALPRPYFPLRRFGDFWFQVTANGRSEFYTFESHLDRDNAYDKRYDELMQGNQALKDAAQSMRAGNSISDLFLQNKDVGGVLKEINDLIDNIATTTTTVQGGQAFTTAASADAVKNEMKQAINQLVYVMLPQQSMRKMFINRKAVQGASGDMLRVFAETATRSAYQLSRYKYTQPFLDNLANARNYIDKYEKGKQQTVTRDYLTEVERRYKVAFGLEDKSDYARFAGKAQQAMFYMNMTAPASILVQVIAFPIMAQRVAAQYGVVKANTTFGKYFGLYGMSTPERTLRPLAGGLMSSVKFPSIAESSLLTGASARAAKVFLDDGDFQASLTNDTFDLTKDSTFDYTNKTQIFLRALTVGLHQVERLTREVMLLSVFDMAYEKYLTADKRNVQGIIERDPTTGQPLKYTEQEAFNMAINDARDAGAQSMGEFVRQLKGRVFATPTGALILQFKQVPLTIMRNIFRDMWMAFGAPFTKAERAAIKAQLEDHYKTDPNFATIVPQKLKEYDDFRKEIYREAFKKVVYVNAAALIMAGAEGTPAFLLANFLYWVASVFAPDGDEWEDFEEWFFNMLMDSFSGANDVVSGATGMEPETAEKVTTRAAHAIARGIPADVTNWSLTERIGVNPKDMLFRDARFSPDVKETMRDYAVSMGGALSSFVFDSAPSAYQLAMEGHYGRAFERLFPAPSTPLKSYRYGEEGVTLKSGKQIVHRDDLDMWDLASRAIGFEPETVAIAKRAGYKGAEKIVVLETRKTKLLNRIWTEKINNSSGLALAMEEFYMFAAKHPDLVPDPGKAIEESEAQKYEALINAAANLGVDIKENMLIETAPGMRGAKQFLQNR